MLEVIAASVRQILPSRVIAALGILLRRRQILYTGSYATWDAAKHDAIGYDDPAILEKIRLAALTVKAGRAAFERDSIPHARPEFRWPLLASILSSALRKRAYGGPALHVVDFGGSLGSVYFQHRVFLNTMPLMWSIVERPHLVRCGNTDFADDRLRFFDTLAGAAARGPIDVAVFSGSLDYLDTPYEALAEIAALGIRYLILDQLHMVEGREDQIKLQHVRPPVYVAKLAVRFFAKESLMAYLSSLGYDLFATLPLGFLFERGSDDQSQRFSASAEP